MRATDGKPSFAVSSGEGSWVARHASVGGLQRVSPSPCGNSSCQSLLVTQRDADDQPTPRGRWPAVRHEPRRAYHQLAAPFTFILIAVTLSTGPVMTKSLLFRPANVLLVAPVPVGIVRM